ncbi:MAG TPA: PfkB family carbohydrate kinase [Methylomirabilota bacterium]|nr:PfkB family carbohydrate kinase [Methylomirabilota bacterium]
MTDPDTALDIALVGGCHRDVIARTAAPFEPGTSCPGRVMETAGGVARNVAVLAASAGLRIGLVSRTGQDEAGRALVRALDARGIDTGAVVADPGAATGCYVAVHGDDGELVAAVSDLSVYDRITPSALEPAWPTIARAGLVFADANLPTETLTVLAERAGGRLCVDAISRAKAGRVLAALRAGALGFVNLPSAEAIAGRALAGAEEAASALRDLGVLRAVVTSGARPVAVLTERSIEIAPVPAVAVVDVTGAGDALIAGALTALSAGASLRAAVEVGILASGAALGSSGALDKLPPSVLQAARSAARTGASP